MSKGRLAAEAKRVRSYLHTRRTMWKIGDSYTIETWEDDDNNGMITKHHGCRVVGVEGTLIKIQQGRDEKIVNTASVAFVAAVRE